MGYGRELSRGSKRQHQVKILRITSNKKFSLSTLFHKAGRHKRAEDPSTHCHSQRGADHTDNLTNAATSTQQHQSGGMYELTKPTQILR